MEIIIRNTLSEPIYQQIVGQFKSHILGGVLESGEILPSMRKLAKDVEISVITVKRAYDLLEKEGFIITVGGKGTYVADQNKEFLKEKKVRVIETKLSEAINEAKMLGLSLEELQEILVLLYSE